MKYFIVAMASLFLCVSCKQVTPVQQETKKEATSDIVEKVIAND
jgi:hypothetical protein